MMPDDKIKRLLDVLVNRFWWKWSRQPMKTDREWDLFVADVDALFSGGEDYQLAADLIMAFVAEMERRHKEGGQNEN